MAHSFTLWNWLVATECSLLNAACCCISGIWIRKWNHHDPMSCRETEVRKKRLRLAANLSSLTPTKITIRTRLKRQRPRSTVNSLLVSRWLTLPMTTGSTLVKPQDQSCKSSAVTNWKWPSSGLRMNSNEHFLLHFYCMNVVFHVGILTLFNICNSGVSGWWVERLALLLSLLDRHASPVHF